MQPHGAAALLAGIKVPWWVAGGWAVDLFLGFKTRSHKDLDLGVLRRDVANVQLLMSEWDVFEVKAATLYRLSRNELPRPDVNSLWCRPKNARDWSLELMLDESDGNQWVFRRLTTVRRSLASAIRRTSDGIPYLAPEIQLLYKARNPRREDQADFENVLERLGPSERGWLSDALLEVHPDHAWLTRLRP
jgi:hypothetical protein